MKRKDWRALAIGLGFTAPWIVGFSAFLAYPVLASLFYSFCDYSILQRPVFIGLGNYRELLHDEVFWLSLRNTLFYAAFSVPLGVLTSLSFALLLHLPVRGRAFFRAPLASWRSCRAACLAARVQSLPTRITSFRSSHVSRLPSGLRRR